MSTSVKQIGTDGGRAQKGKSAYERIKSGSRITEQQTQELAYLHRGVLSSKLRYPTISAGSTQPNRLSITGPDQCIIASRNELYTLQWRLPEDISDVKAGTQGVGVSTILQFDAVDARQLEFSGGINSSLPTEIQCIDTATVSDKVFIAAVDAIANVAVYTTSQVGQNQPEPSQNGTLSSSPRSKKAKVSFACEGHVIGSKNRGCETGWAGVRIKPDDPSEVVSAHFWEKRLKFYSTEHQSVTREIGTMFYPTQLHYMKSGLASREPLAVCAEYNQISVWDPRVQEKNGCVARDSPAVTSCIYGLTSTADGNTLICGGQDRIAYVYDTRTWRVRQRWKCPLKYDCVSLFLSPSDPSLCYAGGLDHEIMCGEYNPNSTVKKIKDMDQEKEGHRPPQSILQQNHRLGMRGDSRWIGIDVRSVEDSRGAKHDLVAGFCEAGSLYVINQAEYLHPKLLINDLSSTTAN